MVAGHEGTATFGPLCHRPRTLLLFLFQPWRGHCSRNLQAFDRMAPGRSPALGLMLRWFQGVLPALSGSPCLGLSCPAASPLHHLPHPCFWCPHSVHQRPSSLLHPLSTCSSWHCCLLPVKGLHLPALLVLYSGFPGGAVIDKQSAFPCRTHGVQSLCWENPLE